MHEKSDVCFHCLYYFHSFLSSMFNNCFFTFLLCTSKARLCHIHSYCQLYYLLFPPLDFQTDVFLGFCLLEADFLKLFHPLIKQFLQQISKVAFLTSITITPQKIIKIWFSYLRFISPLGWWSRT